MPVEMKLSRIIISEINEQQVIYLKEVGGDRQFPILIGIFEATSIDRRVKDDTPPRPLTHDLLVNIVEALGAELDSVLCCRCDNSLQPTCLEFYDNISCWMGLKGGCGTCVKEGFEEKKED